MPFDAPVIRATGKTGYDAAAAVAKDWKTILRAWGRNWRAGPQPGSQLADRSSPATPEFRGRRALGANLRPTSSPLALGRSARQNAPVEELPHAAELGIALVDKLHFTALLQIGQLLLQGDAQGLGGLQRRPVVAA